MKKTLTPRRAVCGLLAALAAAAAVWLLCRWVGYDLQLRLGDKQQFEIVNDDYSQIIDVPDEGLVQTLPLKAGQSICGVRLNFSTHGALYKSGMVMVDLYDENGQAQCDLIAMDGEVIEAGKPVTMVNLDSDAIERIVTIVPTRVKQLLVPHILNGELAIELPSIAEKKAYIVKQLTEETWESELRIEMPHKHYVNMTPAVAECRSKMYAELHGGKV